MFRCLTGLSALTFLFTISMEWWLKHSTNTTNLVRDVGLKHSEHPRLTDLCFADNAALIGDTVGGPQITTDSVAYWAENMVVLSMLTKPREWQLA